MFQSVAKHSQHTVAASQLNGQSHQIVRSENVSGEIEPFSKCAVKLKCGGMGLTLWVEQ